MGARTSLRSRVVLGLTSVGLAVCTTLAAAPANAAPIEAKTPVAAVQQQMPIGAGVMLPAYYETYVRFTGYGKWLFWRTCNYEKLQYNYYGSWQWRVIERWYEFC